MNRLIQDKGEAEIRYTGNQAAFRLKDEKGSSVLIISKLIKDEAEHTWKAFSNSFSYFKSHFK